MVVSSVTSIWTSGRDRVAATTSAPASPVRRTISAPIPRAPPTTRIRLPVRFSLMTATVYICYRYLQRYREDLHGPGVQRHGGDVPESHCAAPHRGALDGVRRQRTGGRTDAVHRAQSAHPRDHP